MAIDGGRVVIEISADTDGFTDAVSRVRNETKSLQQELSSGTKIQTFNQVSEGARAANLAISDLGRGLANIGWGVFQAGATAATGALTSLVRKGIQSADFLETARTQMSGLTGSFEEGNRAMSIAANYWQNNPFQRIDVTKATQQLIQFGRTTDQIGSDLEMLGNVSLSTKTPIDELARYFARTAASGRAMTMDIEMMSDRGIPIYRELAKQLGTTTAGVRDMASKGKIDFEIFRKALEGAVNPEAMEQFENTLARQVDRIKGSVQILAGELAGYKIINDELVISENGLEKAWTRLLKVTATGLRDAKLKESLQKLGELLASLLDKVTAVVPALLSGLANVMNFISENSAVLIPILGAALAMFGSLGRNLPVIGEIIGGLSTQFGNLTGGLKKLIATRPLLAGFLGVFAVAFVNALKNSEEFRQSISRLVGAIGKIAQALGPAIQAIVNAFASFASSGAFTQVLIVITNILASLAEVIASFPTPVLVAIITALGTFALINKAGPLGYAAAIAVVIGALKQFIQTAGGLEGIGRKIGEFFAGIGEFFANVGKNIATAGYNMMVGLLNGLIEGSKAVINFVRDLANWIVNTFKAVLGIHSPSTVMREMGYNIGLGLANGITDSKSVVQKAMDSLATAVLEESEKVIGNRSDFGLIDANGMYKDWKRVSQLFAVGSQQYQKALEKMEEARKQANLRILNLQNTYNQALDETIDKIATMYGTFQQVDLTGGMDATQIIKNMDQQLAQIEEWASSQEIIANLNLDEGFIEELQALGVESTNELSEIAAMSSDQLAQLNDLWVKKQKVANDAAVKQLGKYRTETLNEIAELKDGIDGETVEVTEVGGRLVSNIGDGITGALPTLDSAFKDIDKYLAEATKSLSSSAGKASAKAMEAAVPEVGDTVKSVKGSLDTAQQQIGASIEEMGQNLLGILAGVAGAIVGSKVLKKALSTAAARIAGSTNIFKSIGEAGAKAGEATGAVSKISVLSKEVGKVGKEATTAATQVSNIGTLAKGTTVVSQDLTRGQQFFKTARSAILDLILLAGAIAALAVALRVAYEAIPDDIGGLIAKMGALVGVTTVMGAVAVAAGKFKIGKDEILPLVEIAGVIALLGVALGVANAMIPNDVGLLIGKLAVMVSVTAAIGVLAAAAGVFAKAFKLKEGLIILCGIAGVIALLGLALGAADAAIQSDFGTLIGKLGAMGAAVVEIGVLAGIIGAVLSTGVGAIILGAGMIAILAIAGELVVLANAIREMDEKVPEDLGRVKNKIDVIVECISYMGQANLGNLFENVYNSINIAFVAGVASHYVEIGKNLETIQQIDIDKDKVLHKVELIRDVVNMIGVKDEKSLGSAIRTIISNFANAAKTFSVGEITTTYRTIAENLNYIQNIELDSEKIITKVALIKSVVDYLGKTSSDSVFGELIGLVNTFIKAQKDAKVKEIVDTYYDIAQKLNEIQNIDMDYAKVTGKVIILKNIVNYLGATGEGSVWKALEDTHKVFLEASKTNAVGDIVKVYSDMVDNLKKIEGFNTNEGTLKEKMDQLKGMVDSITNEYATDNILQAVSRAQGVIVQAGVAESVAKIVGSYKDIAQAANQIEDLPADDKGNVIAEQKISALSNIINTITSTAQRSWWDKFWGGDTIDAEYVNGINNIIQQLNNIADSANNLHDLYGGNAGDANRKIDSIKEVVKHLADWTSYGGADLNIQLVEQVMGLAVSTIHRYADFVETANNMPTLKEKFAENVIQPIRHAVWEVCQINQNVGDLDNKLWVVQKATEIAGELVKFDGVVNQLSGNDKSGVIQSLVSSMATMVQSVIDTLEERVKDLAAVGAQMGDRLAEGIDSKKETIKGAAYGLQDALWSALQEKMEDEYQQGAWMAQRFSEGLKSKINDLSEAGHQMQNAVWRAIQDRMGDEYQQGQALGQSFRQGLYDVDYGNSGWWAVQGFLNGANSRAGDRGNGVFQTGYNIAKRFLDGLRKGGDEGSPWKTTFRSGNYAVEGLIEGMREMETPLTDEATRLAEAVVDALDVSDVAISPGLDVSSVPVNRVAPEMVYDEQYGRTNRREVVIEQTNNNYTDYDIGQVNRDLSWALSRA